MGVEAIDLAGVLALIEAGGEGDRQPALYSLLLTTHPVTAATGGWFIVIPRSLLILICLSMLSACGGVRHPHFGVREGRLAPCAGIFGCLSSGAEDPEQRIEPLRYASSRQEAKAILLTILNDTSGLTIVSNHRNYVRVEMRQQAMEDFPGASAVIDDVEFYLDPVSSEIHVRAEPRLSRPDSGTTAQRIQELAARFFELHQRYRRRAETR